MFLLYRCARCFAPLHRGASVASLSRSAKRRSGVGTFSPNRTSWRPLRSFIPAGAERFFVSMQPRFGARRSTPSGPTFAALWCHSPSRRRRRPFQRGRIDQPVAFSRGWSLSADAFEDRELNALSCRLFKALSWNALLHVRLSIKECNQMAGAECPNRACVRATLCSAGGVAPLKPSLHRRASCLSL